MSSRRVVLGNAILLSLGKQTHINDHIREVQPLHVSLIYTQFVFKRSGCGFTLHHKSVSSLMNMRELGWVEFCLREPGWITLWRVSIQVSQAEENSGERDWGAKLKYISWVRMSEFHLLCRFYSSSYLCFDCCVLSLTWTRLDLMLMFEQNELSYVFLGLIVHSFSSKIASGIPYRMAGTRGLWLL